MFERRKIKIFVETMEGLHRKLPGINELQTINEQIRDELRHIQEHLTLRTGRSSADIKERGRLQTEKTRLLGQLNLIREKLPASTGFEELYRQIRAVPMVRDLYINGISGPELVIITETLYGRSYESEWHRIGAFQISIDLIDTVSDEKFPSSGEIKSVRWKNLQGTVKCGAGPSGTSVGEWQSPMYINSKGHSVCFGMDRSMLKKTLAEQDWLTVAKIVVRYPECAGQSNAIVNWPKVDASEVPGWYLTNFK